MQQHRCQPTYPGKHLDRMGRDKVGLDAADFIHTYIPCAQRHHLNCDEHALPKHCNHRGCNLLLYGLQELRE
eukprot:jgi/Mesvir1/1935/Mv26060-RA.1